MEAYERRQQQQRVINVARIVLEIEQEACAKFLAENPQYDYVRLCDTCNTFLTVRDIKQCDDCIAKGKKL